MTCEPFWCDDDADDWVVWQTIVAPGSAADVEVDADGNSYVAGYYGNSNIREYLAKFDGNGVVLWERIGSGFSFSRVAIDASGVIWAVGDRGTIARYLSDGTELGRGEYHGGDYLFDIEFDSSGNVYIAGGQGQGMDTRAFIAKYSPSLELVWSRNHDVWSMGQSVAVDGAGNAYLAGRFEVAQNGALYGSRLLLNRYDSSGTLTFSVAPPGCSNNFVSATGATADANGDVYVTGDYCAIDTALMEKWSLTSINELT